MSTRKKVLVVAAIASVLAATVLAQVPHFRHRAGMHALIAGHLDLTDTQKTDAKAIFGAARESARPLVEQLKEGHEAMRDAIKAGSSDQELQALADQQGIMIGQVAGIYAKAFAKFYASLNPEQKEKAEELHDHFKGFRGHGFGGRFRHF
jgi:Spy/CpxP family protein refolding chaperone